MSGSPVPDLCSQQAEVFFVARHGTGRSFIRWHPRTLSCKECGQTYPLEARYVCEQCFGPLEVAYDHSGFDAARGEAQDPGRPGRASGATRTSCRSPSARATRCSPGLTPLLRADRLAERLGLGEVWIKNDAANPTHSFKDRVVAVALAKARELGFETVACASTGNLANAVAAHAAAAGLESYVFVPADLEEQKLLATGVYGTSLVGVRGNYDDVNRLCTELCETRPWAFVNVNLRPYYAEGSKTIAYETRRAARLVAARPGRLPDRLGLAVHEDRQGFAEWLELGLVEGELPAFNGAQAAGCNPVAEAYRGRARTSAARSGPRRSRRASRSAIRPTASTRSSSRAQTGGSIESVTDDEIRAGIRLLAETTGIFTETAGGVTTAVLAKLAEAGAIDADERVVAIITGEGLKTLDAVREGFAIDEIEPTLDVVRGRGRAGAAAVERAYAR